MRSLPCLSTQHSSRVESLRLDAFTTFDGDPDEESLLRLAGTIAEKNCVILGERITGR